MRICLGFLSGVIHLVDKVMFPYVHDQAGWGK